MRNKILFCLLATCLLAGVVNAGTIIEMNVAHDGYVMNGTDAAWETVARAPGNLVTDGGLRIYSTTLGTATQISYHRRAILVFNGSDIGDTDTIDSVKVSAYGYSKAESLGTVNASLIDAYPENPLDFIAGDYDSTTFTRQANDIAYADFNLAGYNNWTLTNTSLVNKTGLFSYILTHSADVDLSPLTPSAASSGFIHVATGTGSNPPFITIEYTPAAGGDTTPPASLSGLSNTTTCNSINFTWTNPINEDFNGTMYWLNGTLQNPNLTNTTTFKLIEGLTDGLSVQFASKTFDNVSNINATFQNMTAITKTLATASFTKNATNGLVPFHLQVNDTSTGTALSMWNWSWGDSTWTNTTTAEERNATHTYGTGGNYTIFLITSNSCGSDQSDNQYVDVWNITYAGFSADPLEGKEPLTVTFTDSSANATTWSWDIDDDGSEDYNTQNPSHQYTVVGLYTVNLTVGNGHSTDFERKVNYINITDGTPPASILNLVGNNSTCGVVQWTWDNPADADYSHLITYKNGEWHSNVSAPTDYLNWSGVGGEFASRTCDSNGNCNTTWINETIGDAEVCDVTPPLAPINLANTTTCNSINWTWEAQDEDYHGVLVYRLDEGDPPGDYFYHFVIEPTFHDLWEGLDEDTDYTISLKSWDGGNVNDTWVNMTAHTPFCPVTPVANFTMNQSAGFPPLGISFKDASTNSPDTWNWSFGEGVFSDLQDPDYIFGTGGNYTINLTVSNEAGSSSMIKYAEVWNYTTVDFSANVTEGDYTLPVAFTDSSTNATSWYWMFGEGNTSTDQNPTHEYTFTGLFTVNHSASNAHHTSWENKTTYINVTTPADTTPPASITSLTGTVNSCSQITWDWTNPPDPDYDLLMVYRNGVFLHNITFPTTEDVWNALAESTSYQFAGRTVDTSGNLNTSWTNLTRDTTACYVPAPPVANFHADNTTPAINQDVHFTDDSSNTPNTWSWNFGDGNSSNVQDPTHAYGYNGTFTVSLTVTNADGNDDEIKTNYIVVSAPADSTPPASITALNNTTTSCNAIEWTWTIPGDPDYSRLLIYRNGVFFEYANTPTAISSWAGLTENTDYEFASHTQDATGNTNTTWINRTAHTPACPIGLPVASFTANITCAIIPFAVQFNDTSTGAGITDYYWDFASGVNSTVQNPLINYTIAGVYGVDHSVTNPTGTSWKNETGYIRARAVGDTCAAAPSGGSASGGTTSGGTEVMPLVYGIVGGAAVLLVIAKK